MCFKMDLAPKAVLSVAARMSTEVQLIHGKPQHLQLLTLERIRHDLPLLLAALNTHKSSSVFHEARSALLALSADVDNGLFLARKTEKTKIPEPQPKVDEEDYATLRRRLLDGSTRTEQVDMNDYHENAQEELYKDLGELATGLKHSAAALSEKVAADGSVLATTSENMLRGSALMQAVGGNLNAYLLLKSGGKITLWFMLKAVGGVVLLFAVLLLLTQLPKM